MIKFGDFTKTGKQFTHFLFSYGYCTILGAYPILFKCGALFICFRVTPNTYHKINDINLTLSFYNNALFGVGGQKTYLYEKDFIKFYGAMCM